MSDLSLPSDWQRIWQAACQVRQRAYAPYSGFLVGAAFKRTGSREPSVGCNVENASYGATLCAERNALFQAISQKGAPLDLEYLVLVTDTEKPTVPCALCLQVLSEFCPPEFPIYLANLKGHQETVLFGDLLTRPFNKF